MAAKKLWIPTENRADLPDDKRVVVGLYRGKMVLTYYDTHVKLWVRGSYEYFRDGDITHFLDALELLKNENKIQGT